MEIFNYDNRELRILNILEKSSTVREEYLQNVLKVSSKTIKNEIKKLNIFFTDTAYIKIDKEVYKLYIIKFEKYLEMKKQLSKLYENFDSNKVRVVFIFKELIESKGYKLIDDLSEVMMISRTTFNNDVKKLKKIIALYELKIQGKTNTGIALKGQEKDIRLFILDNIYNYIYKDDIFDLEDNQNFMEIFKKHNINDHIYDTFLKYLTISLSRYGNEFYLNSEKDLYDELLEYYTSWTKWAVGEVY